MNQVHKENLTTVENALPNRSAADIEIFGMEGIPDDVMQQHNQRVSHEFFAAEAERRAATGNPVPGSSAQGAAGTKKPKLETPAELKARLAEHKARKAAEKSGLTSAPDTPVSLIRQYLATMNADLSLSLSLSRLKLLLLPCTNQASLLLLLLHKLPVRHQPRIRPSHMAKLLPCTPSTSPHPSAMAKHRHRTHHPQGPSRQVSLVPSHPIHPHSLMAFMVRLHRLRLLASLPTQSIRQVRLNTRTFASLHP
jgi:hypothetical protein